MPLLKWPGGKRALLKYILSVVPRNFDCYYEPFLGGAALFFALQPQRAVLADNHLELINCYTQVRDRPEAVVGYLSSLENSAETYYQVRASEPTDQIERAARLLYLTTLAFNGIHRVNLAGKFNVPYGGKTHLVPCDEQKILVASEALSKASIRCGDFADSVAEAGRGDFVYLDPPYTVAHGKNGFLKYNTKIFSWDDQLRLARIANDLVQRGCRVAVSNADHESIIPLYGNFCRLNIERTSRVAADARHRKATTEVVFYNEG